MKTCLILLLLFSTLPITAQEIDTKHLKLQLQFNWQKKQATGVAELSLTMLKPGAEILLDAGFLNIQNVTLNKSVLKYTCPNNDSPKNLHIYLDRIYHPTEVIKIKIEYSTNYENKADVNAIAGSFGKGLRYLQPTSTTPAKHRQIWSSGEPESNKYWFPCNEDIADIHTTELFATVEKPLTVISVGNLTDTKINPNGTQTFHYTTEKAFPNYLVFIVVGEYQSYSQQCGNTTLKHFGYPQEIKALQATVELLPDMMQFLESKTGYTYPFKNYSQVVVQDYLFPGLVGQHGASILSDNYVDDFGVHKDYQYLWDGVAMQALSNQWFGNIIMPASWKDLWLNNAFAQYFAGLYTSKCHTKDEYLTYYYPFERANVTGDWYQENIHPIVPDKVTNLESFTTDSYTKYKGALVLRMLQKELGEENWWNSIRYFLTNYAYKQVTTKDFQKSIETISGKSYQWFFDQWIYKIGLPKLQVQKEYHPLEKKFTVTVLQTPPPENKTGFLQVEYFQGTIQLELDTKTETIYLLPQAENHFSFSANEKPKLFNFNFQESFFCEVTETKTTEECLYLLATSKDVLAKQRAIDWLINYVNDSTTQPIDTKKVYDALIREISASYHFRYRWYALSSLRKMLPLPYNKDQVDFLTSLIKNDASAWVKSTAIFMLGATKNPEHEMLYISKLRDSSDRVINAAAFALGLTKGPNAFNELMALEKRPSWKNQNRISALFGLQQLGDERAADYALSCLKDTQSPRWYLATPSWDYPYAAVNTLVTLGKAKLAYPILIEQLKQSLKGDDLKVIFMTVQLIDLLKDERAKEMYTLLYTKFSKDSSVCEAVKNYEAAFLNSLNPGDQK